MIMGNTDIALPTEQDSVTIIKSKGIPAVPTQQESRSVLGKEVEINSSPLLTRSYIMVSRRQMGWRVNPYALAHIHATDMCVSICARRRDVRAVSVPRRQGEMYGKGYIST
jgi:hypothetical protein